MCRLSLNTLLFTVYALFLAGAVGKSPCEAGESKTIEWNVKDLEPVAIDRADPSIRFRMYYLYYHAFTGEINHLTDSSVLYSDDLYKIIFTPEEDCYVYIFQIDSSGEVVQLFPLNNSDETPQSKSNPVQSRKTYSVPAEDRPFKMAAKMGRKEIYLLASRQGDARLEEQYQTLLFAQRQQDSLAKKLKQDRLRETIQGQSSPIISFVVNAKLEANLPVESPTTEREIIKALSIKPRALPTSQTRFSEWAARELDKKTDPSDKMLKVRMFDVFDDRSATIVSKAYPLLRAYGKILQNELKDVVLIIAGHTDDRGSDIYNLNLSKRRAEAVKQFFVTEYQIAESRLLIKPYGENKPIALNETAEGRRLNNRIEFIRIQ